MLSGLAPGPVIDAARARPEGLAELLASPALHRRIFGSRGWEGQVSPVLVFAVAVHHAAAALGRADFLTERVGPRQRLPVFDVEPLRELAASEERRLFLVDLLASFTKVAGGTLWVRTRRGVRRRRWSELDPVQLVQLVELAPPAARPGFLRRLGDVALFSSGVFPEAIAGRRISVAQLRLLSRSAEVDPSAAAEVLAGDDGLLGLLEVLGQRWYRAGARGPEAPVVREIADRYVPARRFLAHVADRYLFRVEGLLPGVIG